VIGWSRHDLERRRRAKPNRPYQVIWFASSQIRLIEAVNELDRGYRVVVRRPHISEWDALEVRTPPAGYHRHRGGAHHHPAEGRRRSTGLVDRHRNRDTVEAPCLHLVVRVSRCLCAMGPTIGCLLPSIGWATNSFTTPSAMTVAPVTDTKAPVASIVAREPIGLEVVVRL